jgi:hypothetical protein
MSLKRQRSHMCGFSNIDFRSKGEFENVKLYEPWKIPKDFGTMGKSNYHLSYTNAKKIFSVSKNLNKFKNIVQDSPDPKFYKTAMYYKKNRITPNTIQDFYNERIAQLDEIDIGKEKYIGDSMMISDIYRYRNQRKNQINSPIRNLINKQKDLNRFKKPKELQNKSAKLETQLVKLDVNETLDDKINLEKIQEIRFALRRRYANRTDIRKIFKEWDINCMGEITLYSAHDMINRLNIPINYNETRALIASSNTRGTETLNLEEFIHLIFSDNEALQIDLDKLKYKDEKLYKEGMEAENIKNNMKKSILEINKTNEILFIKHQVHSRTTIINNAAHKNNINKDKCSKNDFIKLMRSLKFPEKYYRDILIDSLYNSYINKDDNSMNVNKFIDDCLKLNEDNNFMDFKEKNLKFFEKKIKNQIEEKDKTIQDLLSEKNSRLKLADDLINQIEEKKKYKKKLEMEENNKLKEVINPQPSTEFINKVYKDHFKMFKKLNEVEDKFSTKPNSTKKDKPKTRFNGNPAHKDTFYMINQDPRGSSFITEKDRFNITTMNELTDFIRKEREQKKIKDKAKLKKINFYETMREDACKRMEKIFEQKDLSCQNKRSIRQYNYELLNRIRNEFIE